MDAPTSKRNDPRAHAYIIDHLNPGQTIRRRVGVRNDSAEPRTVELYPAAATIQDNRFTFADGRTPNELTSWITLDRNSMTVAPDRTGTVMATIAVPSTASEGERYAVIWAQTTAVSTGANVTQISRLGVRVYLDIGPGGEPPSGFDITELTADRTPDGTPRVTAHVRNTGARALDITGTLTLSDGPASSSAGPFRVATAATLAPGQAGLATVLLDPRLPDGPWQAHVTLVSGVTRREVTATITFPKSGAASQQIKPASYYWTIGLTLVILALTALILYARRRRRRTRAAPTPQSLSQV
jgi:hypothetical protein